MLMLLGLSEMEEAGGGGGGGEIPVYLVKSLRIIFKKVGEYG